MMPTPVSGPGAPVAEAPAAPPETPAALDFTALLLLLLGLAPPGAEPGHREGDDLDPGGSAGPAAEPLNILLPPAPPAAPTPAPPVAVPVALPPAAEAAPPAAAPTTAPSTPPPGPRSPMGAPEPGGAQASEVGSDAGVAPTTARGLVGVADRPATPDAAGQARGPAPAPGGTTSGPVARVAVEAPAPAGAGALGPSQGEPFAPAAILGVPGPGPEAAPTALAEWREAPGDGRAPRDEPGPHGAPFPTALRPGPVAPGASRDVAAAGEAGVPRAEPPRLADQVVRAARVVVRDGLARMEVQLDPPALGAVRINADARGDVLALTITAERPETQALLAQALPDIRQALESRGMGDASVAVLSTPLAADGRRAPERRPAEPRERPVPHTPHRRRPPQAPRTVSAVDITV